MTLEAQLKYLFSAVGRKHELLGNLKYLYNVQGREEYSIDEDKKERIYSIYSQIVHDDRGNTVDGDTKTFFREASGEERLIYSSVFIHYLRFISKEIILYDDKMFIKSLEFNDYIFTNFKSRYVEEKASDSQMGFIFANDRALTAIDAVISANHLYSKIKDLDVGNQGMAIKEFLEYQNAVLQGDIFDIDRIEYDIDRLSNGGRKLIKIMDNEVPFDYQHVGMVFEQLRDIGIEKEIYSPEFVPEVKIWK